MAKKATYGNESIKSLRGADRVRKRPAVIFGSDGLEGCEHSIFEIMSNSIDEAREGRGNRIVVTRYLDGSYEVQDFGSGIPVDYNKNEQRENWELLFCEMYAGSKYDNAGGAGSYEFSLGLNGLGLCATQYASEYMDAEIHRDGYCYTLHFEKGENIGGLHKEPYHKRDTGSRIRWKPDIQVFTDINIPRDWFVSTMKRQAIVNDGVHFVLKEETAGGKFNTNKQTLYRRSKRRFGLLSPENIENNMSQTEKATKRNPWAWIPTLYFAQGIPFIFNQTCSKHFCKLQFIFSI